MQYFGVPKCPYCNKRVNVIRTWSLKKQGEYKCPRCKGISNVFLSPLVYIFAVIAVLAALVYYAFHKFILDDINLITVAQMIIPFAAFFLLSQFTVYLKKPVIKKAPKKPVRKVNQQNRRLTQAEYANRRPAVDSFIDDNYAPGYPQERIQSAEAAQRLPASKNRPDVNGTSRVQPARNIPQANEKTVQMDSKQIRIRPQNAPKRRPPQNPQRPQTQNPARKPAQRRQLPQQRPSDTAISTPKEHVVTPISIDFDKFETSKAIEKPVKNRPNGEFEDINSTSEHTVRNIRLPDVDGDFFKKN